MINDEEFLNLFKRGIEHDLPRFGMIPELNEYHTLVIGNGFDLQCGLKTTYTHFFNYSLEEKAKNGDEIYKTINDEIKTHRKKGFYNFSKIEKLYSDHKDYLSVWDIYFIYSNVSCKTWSDVEKLIRQSLVDDHFWDEVEQVYEQIIDGVLKEEIREKEHYNIYDILALLIYERYDTINGEFIGKKVGQLTIKTFYDNLVKELKVFERRFGRYIKKQYKSHKKKYDEVARENIRRIFEDGISKTWIASTQCYLRIISFNYIPLLDDSLNNGQYVQYIHGSIDNPIFCIDEITDNRKYPNAEYYNLFSNKHREECYGTYNIKDDSLYRQPYYISVLTYGLSFSDIDIEDFKRILAPNFKKFPHDNQRDFRQIIAYTPKNQEEMEYKSETTSNIGELVKHIDNSKTSLDTLMEGANPIIRVLPIELTSIKKTKKLMLVVFE